MQWLVLRAIQQWSWEQESDLSGLGAESFPWAQTGTGPQISGEVGSLLSVVTLSTTRLLVLSRFIIFYMESWNSGKIKVKVRFKISLGPNARLQTP